MAGLDLLHPMPDTGLDGAIHTPVIGAGRRHGIGMAADMGTVATGITGIAITGMAGMGIAVDTELLIGMDTGVVTAVASAGIRIGALPLVHIRAAVIGEAIPAEAIEEVVVIGAVGLAEAVGVGRAALN